MKHLFLNRLRLVTVVTAAFFLTSCNDQPEENENPSDTPKSTEAAGSTATTKGPRVPSPDAEVKTYVVSGNSKVEWTGSKGTESHSGGFANFVGKFQVADGLIVPKGKHFITIDMASVFSDDEELTTLLKSADFFEVGKFPIARFQLKEATPVEGEEPDRFEVSGILDLHGMAKQITFPATLKISDKGTLLDMAAEFPLSRQDFGMTNPGKEGELIEDEVVLNFSVSAMPGEPKELVLMDKTQESTGEEKGRSERGKGKGGKGGKGLGGGKGRPDWGNMSDEERQKARQEFMARIDKNGDGNIGKDEVPERAWEFMSRADKNGDDMLSESERTEFRAQMQAERELRELSGESFRGGGDGKGRGGRGGKGGGDRSSD